MITGIIILAGARFLRPRTHDSDFRYPSAKRDRLRGRGGMRALQFVILLVLVGLGTAT